MSFKPSGWMWVLFAAASLFLGIGNQAFPAAHAKRFKANKAAWAWYSKQAPWYQRTTIWYVVSAVKPETQARRLATLIAASAEQRRIIGPTGKVETAPT